ncbi:MAG: C45 family autoproteolytic acyltransferase/hydrolase [Actinomycetota bacterium]
MSEVRIVRAKGDPVQRGQLIGRELRDLVNESIDFYGRYMSRRGVSTQQLQDLLTPYLASAESSFPQFVATLKGMSAGATVPFLELFAVNAFEELEPLREAPEGGTLFLQRKEGRFPPKEPKDPRRATRPRIERCSSFAVTAPGVTLLGHNEQWLAGDLGNVAVVIDVPDDGSVPVVSPTIVSCLPAVGMNGHGVAQGIGSLTAVDDHVGVPRVLVSRHSLEAADRDDAVRRAGTASRAGGYGHVLAFRGGDAITIETTGKELAVLDGPGAHTNHYLDRRLASLGVEPSEGSRSRLARLDQLLAERRPQTPDAVMDVLRDHGPGPEAICLHPDPAEGDEASAVMFSMVADLEASRMWVAPGNPCRNDYVEIDLTGLA